MVKGDCQFTFVRRAALDVTLGKINATFDLGTARDWRRYSSVAEDRYLLAGWGCPDQTGQNDLKVSEVQSPGFFVQVSTTEPISFLVCAASQSYVHYQLGEDEKAALLLYVE